MFYQVTDPNTPLHQALTALWERVIEARNAMKEMGDEIGSHKVVSARGWTILEGGISQAEFDSPPDKKMWCKGSRAGLYRPRLSTKEGIALSQRLGELPIINTSELNDLIGFNPRDYQYVDLNGMHMPQHPSWVYKEGIHLFRYPSLFKGEIPAEFEEIPASKSPLAE